MLRPYKGKERRGRAKATFLQHSLNPQKQKRPDKSRGAVFYKNNPIIGLSFCQEKLQEIYKL
jgi:hypothetical protein